jgi:hypothetical protein
MKTFAILSVTAVMALSSTAYAGGYYSQRSSFLSPTVGVSLGNIGVLNGLLNGNTIAVGNNSSLLSGILSGNNGLLNILGGSRQSNGNVVNSHNGNNSHNNNGNFSHNGNHSHNRYR